MPRSRTRRRTSRLAALLLLGGATALLVGAVAVPAAAEVITGPCTGSADFLTAGVTITESQPVDEVVEVPPEDTVLYAGATNTPPPDDPIPFAGNVVVDLPFGQEWKVVTWAGETVEVEDAGEYSYDVPSFVPRGTGGLLLTATHDHGGVLCVVEVGLTVEGDPGGAAIGAAGATLVFGAGTLAAGIKKRGVA